MGGVRIALRCLEAARVKTERDVGGRRFADQNSAALKLGLSHEDFGARSGRAVRPPTIRGRPSERLVQLVVRLRVLVTAQ